MYFAVARKKMASKKLEHPREWKSCTWDLSEDSQQCPGLRTGLEQGMGGHFVGTQRTRLLCNTPTAVLPPALAPRESRLGHRAGMEGGSLWHQASGGM